MQAIASSLALGSDGWRPNLNGLILAAQHRTSSGPSPIAWLDEAQKVVPGTAEGCLKIRVKHHATPEAGPQGLVHGILEAAV